MRQAKEFKQFVIQSKALISGCAKYPRLLMLTNCVKQLQKQPRLSCVEVQWENVNIIIRKPSACTGNVGWSNFLLVLELRQITVKHRESSMVFLFTLEYLKPHIWFTSHMCHEPSACRKIIFCCSVWMRPCDHHIGASCVHVKLYHWLPEILFLKLFLTIFDLHLYPFLQTCN